TTLVVAEEHLRSSVSPVVVHFCGVSDDPGGIRSSSGFAALRRAAPPPWTPQFQAPRVLRPPGPPRTRPSPPRAAPASATRPSGSPHRAATSATVTLGAS